MIERLAQFIQSLGISVRAFEISIAASDGMLRRPINNKIDIQSKWISSIADNYPQLNLEWLIVGHGSMLRDKQALSVVQELTAMPDESTYYILYKEEKAENKELIKENGRLEERIRTLEAKLKECQSALELTIEHPKDLTSAKDASIKKGSSRPNPNVGSVIAPSKDL